MTTEQIAKVCHDANKSLCELNNDYTQVEWNDAKHWQRESAIQGVEYRLNNPNAPSSSQHDVWSKNKLENGWVYGEIKDGVAKTHPCLVPFEQLPEFQQKKDTLFQAIVDALK